MYKEPIYSILRYKTNNEFWPPEKERKFLTSLYNNRYAGVIITAYLPEKYILDKDEDEDTATIIDGNKRINTIKHHLHLWRFNILTKQFTQEPESDTCLPLEHILDRVALNRWQRNHNCNEEYLRITETVRARIREYEFNIQELRLEFSTEHPNNFIWSSTERKTEYIQKYLKERNEQILEFIKQVREDIHNI